MSKDFLEIYGDIYEDYLNWIDFEADMEEDNPWD